MRAMQGGLDLVFYFIDSKPLENGAYEVRREGCGLSALPAALNNVRARRIIRGGVKRIFVCFA